MKGQSLERAAFELGARELKTTGLRMTLQRSEVLSAIEAIGADHFSVHEVIKQLVAQDAQVGLTTVYRILSKLQESGFLSRHVYKKKATFSLNQEHSRDRMVCLGCHRADRIEAQAVRALKRDAAAAHGYELSELRLTLHGYCSVCSAIRQRLKDD